MAASIEPWIRREIEKTVTNFESPSNPSGKEQQTSVQLSGINRLALQRQNSEHAFMDSGV